MHCESHTTSPQLPSNLGSSYSSTQQSCTMHAAPCLVCSSWQFETGSQVWRTAHYRQCLSCCKRKEHGVTDTHCFLLTTAACAQQRGAGKPQPQHTVHSQGHQSAAGGPEQGPSSTARATAGKAAQAHAGLCSSTAGETMPLCLRKCDTC
jgi:hypothetical protein